MINFTQSRMITKKTLNIYSTEYKHIDDENRKFNYTVVKCDELVEMPEYAVQWCQMLIDLYNANEKPKKLNENFDTFDRDTLKRKFFELNNNSGS